MEITENCEEFAASQKTNFLYFRDLKDQQLYHVGKDINYGVFSPLLNKRADLEIIEEQWESMIRVATSLKKRTAPAHVIVQRLTNSFPSDRLSKAFTNSGRIIKTEYILRYLTDPDLRKMVQLQLNKGEYGPAGLFEKFPYAKTSEDVFNLLPMNISDLDLKK